MVREQVGTVREQDTYPWMEHFLHAKGWAKIESEAKRKEYGRNAGAYLIEMLRRWNVLREDIVVIDAGADKKIALNQIFQSAIDGMLFPPKIKFLAINFGKEVTKKYERNRRAHEFAPPTPLCKVPIINWFVDSGPRRQLIKDTHAIATDFSDRVAFKAALKKVDVKYVDIVILYHDTYKWLFMMAKKTHHYKRLKPGKGPKVRLDLAVAEKALQNQFDVLIPGGLLVFDDFRPPENRPNAVELVAEMREAKLLEFDRAWLLARGDHAVFIVQKPL